MHRVVEVASLAGAATNEDRGGAAASLVWVIDGATDVVEAPLTSAPTDAHWAAEALDRSLGRIAAHPPARLIDLPGVLSAELEAAFAAAAHREPKGRHEHPSASGLVARFDGRRVEWVAVGDCTLLASSGGGVARCGTDERDAGDPWIATAVTAFRAERGPATAAEARAHVWPRITAARAAMNMADGYGVLSITRTPERFIGTGTFEVDPGGYVLLASDGLMRLVDIFHRYTSAGLLTEAARRGVGALLEELREAEIEDGDCLRFPRAKIADDATGVLVRVG